VRCENPVLRRGSGTKWPDGNRSNGSHPDSGDDPSLDAHQPAPQNPHVRELADPHVWARRTREQEPNSFTEFNLTRHSLTILTFDDLVVGDEWVSASRTVTEADVVWFAGLSGDFSPLHVDRESSALGPFGGPVAHGLLGLAISSGLSSQAPRVDTVALLAILEWHFHHPIHFGDTIRVVSTVEALAPGSRGRRGVVTWRRQILNQKAQVVQEGRTQTLVRGRTTERRSLDQGVRKPSDLQS